MDWTEVKLTVPVERLDALLEALALHDIINLAVEDPREVDELLQGSVYCDYIEEEVLAKASAPACVSVYLPQNDQGAEQLARVRAAAADAGCADALALANVNEQDWANNWKKYFKPLQIGQRLLIKPSWEAVKDAHGRVVLELDPSSSFGTGTHATTQLCLEQIERLVAPGSAVLDMGCGSGILGVAAALLGADSVTGVDIEEDSMRVARENAERNAVPEERFALYCGNILTDAELLRCVGVRQYDVILANIVANVIIAMRNLLAPLLAPGGRLVVSGIIDERAEEVRAALEQAGWRICETAVREDWVAMVCER